MINSDEGQMVSNEIADYVTMINGSALEVLQNLALMGVLVGGDTDETFEGVGQVALAAEARRVGDIDNRCACREHILSATHTNAGKIGVRRQPDLVVKNADKIIGTQASDLPQFRQRHVFGIVIV